MAFEVSQGHRNCHYLIGHYIFNAYVTACDLEKSFSFNNTVKLTENMRSPIHVCKHIIANACCIFQSTVSNSKNDLKSLKVIATGGIR